VADNVNIENVGGLRGVASEATLLNLVDAFRRMNPNDPANANSAAKKAQDLYTRSIKDSTASQKDYTSALDGATSKLKDFSEELLIGGDRLSDFANSMFGSTSVLTRFVGYVDGVIDNFRTLSSVGATFGNSMFEMISVSADAAMTLDGFVALVRQNSDALARFGGNVSSGARFIAEFSRDIRLGIGRDFFSMGLTIEDINEGLVGFLDLETMRGRRNLRNDANLQASAANYISQLDLLTRLTGRQRSALMETQQALQTDAKIRNNINRVAARLGDEAANELRNIYTFQRETLPGFHDALMDLSDGVAQSDIGRALESAAPGITRFSMAVANGEISQEEYVRRMQSEFGPRLQQFAGTLDGATLDIYRSRGGFFGALAQIADGSYEFANLMNINVEEAEQEQRRRNRITNTLGQFEQGIIALRKFLFDKFINSAFAVKLGEFGTTLIRLFDENSPDGLGAAGRLFNNFFDTLFGTEGYLTRALDWLANFIEDGRLGTALESMATAVGAVTAWFAQFIENIGTQGFFEAIAIEFRRFMDFMFGERGPGEAGEEGTGPRAGGFAAGILQSLTDAFNEVFNSDDPNNPFNRIWSFFETNFNTWTESLFAEGTEPGLLTRIWNFIVTKFNEWTDSLFANIPSTPLGDPAADVEMDDAAGTPQPGLLARLWAWVEENWNLFVDNLFTQDGALTRMWSWVEEKWEEFVGNLFTQDGALTTLWTWVEEKWEEFVDNIFSNDTTSLWNRFTTALNTYIFGNEETGDLPLWQRFSNAVGLPPQLPNESLFDYFRRIVFGENPDNEGTIIDTIVDMLDQALGRIFAGASFQLMLTDIMGQAELMISRVLNNVIGMRGNFDERIEQLERQREDIAAARQIMANEEGIYTAQDIEQARETLRALGIPGFANGTNGFRNFGSQGSLAVLHNTEAVVPRNSPAGEMLDAFYRAQENRTVSTATNAPTFNQSDLGNKLDQLNSTMQQVVLLLNDSVGVQRRTMRNIHGMGTDLLRG
jgi:hypothetical protein